MSRYEKELSLYRKEVEDLGKKRDKFIAQNAEEWDIKNAVSSKRAQSPCNTK